MSKYYLFGIKGAGMSALAQLLYDHNHEVRGCDFEKEYYTTKGLHARNIQVDSIENAKIPKDYLVIVGNAFVNHERVEELRKQKYWLRTYSEFLGDLSRSYQSIAISGSHGKTTTTNMCRQVLERLEPVNFIVGDGVGGGNPLSDLFVFEACEYKRHFLFYEPKVAVITNIDFDHPDYYRDIYDVVDAFKHFIDQSDFIIYNGEDPHLRDLLVARKKKVSVGLSQEQDIYAQNITFENNHTRFDAYYKGRFYGTMTLPLFGTHNVLNSLLAIALGIYFGVNRIDIQEALEHYITSERRFQIFETPDQIIISDYAHHPVEIRATYESLTWKYNNRQLIAIFEPHTFSRTKAFMKEFIESLELYDEVYLADIFTSVREKEGTVTIEAFANAIDGGKILKDVNVLREKKNAVLVFMGAGTIDQTANAYYQSVMEEKGLTK
ncbi:MAG TPA: UDP-N-acetylmuramate--L-alanine ligase [Haloplasmataceae bacterium]